jgi:hypothetical protein
MSREELDVAAVQRDAQTVQALASRVPALLDHDDPIAHHLAAWVEEIDRGIDPTVVVRVPTSGTNVTPVSDHRGRRAAGVVGVTVMALVISSGAAAAVTGDPLAAVKAPLAALKTINPFAGDGPEDSPAKDLPEVADTNRLLADARKAIAQGELERAEELLERAGSAGDRRVDKLTVRLDEAVDDAKNPKGSKDSNGPRGPAEQDPKDPNGPVDKDPVDKDPVDKDPVDKDPKSDKAKDKGPVDKDPVDKDPKNGKDGKDSSDKESKDDDASSERGVERGSSATRPSPKDDRETGAASGEREAGRSDR